MIITGSRISGMTIAGTVPPTYLSITGGTITYDGDYKIHTFTSNSSFTISQLSNITNDVTVFAVGGGGGGASNGSGTHGSGGGGAGQVIESAYPVSSTGTFNITIGVGATIANYPSIGRQGANTIIQDFGSGTITCIGGYGGNRNTTIGQLSGGNSGNGFLGGTKTQTTSNGGGGAGSTADGYAGSQTPNSGNGGTGYTTTIRGVSETFAGGGGGGAGAFEIAQEPGYGVAGGGNGGAEETYPDDTFGKDALPNTGSGGGGSGQNGGSSPGGAGGSGIVILRYKYQ